MKWLTNLFKSREEKLLEKYMEEAINPIPTPLPPKEYIDVEAIGTYSFKLEKCDNDYFGRRYYQSYTIRFSYVVAVKFLDYDECFNGEFCIDPFSTRRKKDIEINYHKSYMEDVYEYIAELFEDGGVEVMDRVKNRIADDIRKFLADKKVEELKKYVNEGQKLDFRINFKVEK